MTDGKMKPIRAREKRETEHGMRGSMEYGLFPNDYTMSNVVNENEKQNSRNKREIEDEVSHKYENIYNHLHNLTITTRTTHITLEV